MKLLYGLTMLWILCGLAVFAVLVFANQAAAASALILNP